MCKSRCDTEIIPHLYEEHGIDFPKLMRGMFAVALWDASRRRAVLVRDRLGVKPLYYAVAGDTLLYASELKSLLASGLIDTSLDYEAIDSYLTLGFFPGPSTPIANVHKLMPGHLVIVEKGELRLERYWSYPIPSVGTRDTLAGYTERVLAKLRESVRLRLMSDVPLGAMLSGGLDSSLVVALMSEMMSERVKTFSVGFIGTSRGNELDDARCVSRVYATEHFELELSPGDSVDLEQLVWHMDEPIADLSALGFLALCQLARRHVTVALSGQGADELFGGYRKHWAASVVGRLGWAIAPLRPALRAVAGFSPNGFQRALATLGASGPVDRMLAVGSNADLGLRRKIARGPLADLVHDTAANAVARHVAGDLGPLDSALFLDAQLGLVDDMLHYFDRASMAHSLEVRVPFLDHEFVELAATIPSDLKVRGATTKYVLKEAARGLVPDRIVDKRKVGFFNAEVADWFSAQASGPIAQRLLDPKARYAEMIDQRFVERALAENRRGDGSSRNMLLALLMLEIWLSSYLPRASRIERDLR